MKGIGKTIIFSTKFMMDGRAWTTIINTIHGCKGYHKEGHWTMGINIMTIKFRNVDLKNKGLHTLVMVNFRANYSILQTVH